MTTPIHARRDPAARLRLFCLPHAGGGASLYHPWSRLLPREIQVCPIQLPGRENRLRDKPATELPVLVRQLADAMEAHLDLPFAIFGHSMGAAIGFELARELRRRALPVPGRLLMSGLRAPHVPPTLPPLAALDDARFLEAVQARYGRFADEILAEPALLDLILPTLRADLALIEGYCCTPEPPLVSPISVLGGKSDDTVAAEELRAWRSQTDGAFDLTLFPGGHFFPQESREHLLRALEARLLSR